MVIWLRSHECDDSRCVGVSFLELTFGFIFVDPIQFPYRNPMDGIWHLAERRSRFERPTLAYFYGIVRKVFRYLCVHWCDSFPICKGLNRSSWGVTMPLEGIRLRLRPEVMALVQSSLAEFTKVRPIRRSNDFARPVA